MQFDSVLVDLKYQENISFRNIEDVICTYKNSENNFLRNDNIQEKSDDFIVF